jgi:hypothetical protein
MYAVFWSNASASDVFPQRFSTKRDAEAFARQWKREMVAVETTPAARADARYEYEWEIIEVEAK